MDPEPATEDNARPPGWLSEVHPKRPYDFKLQYPVTVGGVQISTLTFTPPKARAMRKMPTDGILLGDLYDLAARLTGQLSAVIDELEPEDLRDVQQVVAVFMQPFLPTG